MKSTGEQQGFTQAISGPELLEDSSVIKNQPPEQLENSYSDQDYYEDPDEDDSDDNPGAFTGVRNAAASEIKTQTVAAPSKCNDNAGQRIDIKTFWPAFLDHLIHERPNMGSFLALACAFPAGEDAIDLKFSSAYRFQYLEVVKKQNKDEIEQHLKNFAGRELLLNITIENKPIEKHEQNFIKAIGNVTLTIDDEIEREPVIKAILDIFDGEVLN